MFPDLCLVWGFRDLSCRYYAFAASKDVHVCFSVKIILFYEKKSTELLKEQFTPKLNAAFYQCLSNGCSAVNGCRQNESPNSW